eukprot:jgi/Mesvir1/8904/Mv02786-RA.1
MERILLTNVIPFWKKTVDRNAGGFKLNHNVDGAWKGAATKTIISQARMTWFFAYLYNSESYSRPEYLDMSALGFHFMRDYMWDRENGGFFWEVTPKGQQAVKMEKSIFGQAYALYALAEYIQASGDPDAWSLARQLSTLLHRYGRDPLHGGFLEQLARDWSHIPGTRRARGASMVPVEHRSYRGIPLDVKSLDNHLALMEAYTTYHTACNPLGESPPLPSLGSGGVGAISSSTAVHAGSSNGLGPHRSMSHRGQQAHVDMSSYQPRGGLVDMSSHGPMAHVDKSSFEPRAMNRPAPRGRAGAVGAFAGSQSRGSISHPGPRGGGSITRLGARGRASRTQAGAREHSSLSPLGARGRASTSHTPPRTLAGTSGTLRHTSAPSPSRITQHAAPRHAGHPAGSRPRASSLGGTGAGGGLTRRLLQHPLPARGPLVNRAFGQRGVGGGQARHVPMGAVDRSSGTASAAADPLECPHHAAGPELLRELLSIQSDTIVDHKHGCVADLHEEDWSPLSPGRQKDGEPVGGLVSYGHNLANIWLLAVAAQAQGVATVAPLLPVFRRMFNYTLQYGVDTEFGGVFEGGPLGMPASLRAKLWWPQAEALVAALYMYR